MDAAESGFKQREGAAVMRRGSYDEAAASLCTRQLRNLAQRRRSAPSLVFGKALGMPCSPIREEPSCWLTLDQCPFVLGLSSENGDLLLDECVQVTEGSKTRDRHIFLFRDVIIFAKLKSSASYRLKHRVSLQDVWLYSFDGEEDPEDQEDERGDIDVGITLMLAWALSVCLLTFCSPEVKQRWLGTLHRQIKEAKERNGCTSPSLLMKVLSGNATKNLTGGGMEHFIGFPLEGDAKVSALPGVSNSQDDMRLAQQPIENSSKWNILRSVLGRKAHQSESRTQLFGQPLTSLCPDDGLLPKPIMDLLALLWKKAPSTEGVFRKPCNNKAMRLVREQLDGGHDVDMGDMNVTNLVGLLKSFLKELPGSLLVSDLYDAWMEALDTEDVQQRPARIKRVVDMLPGPNRLLLRYLLSVLCRVLESAKANKMDAANLAVCIAPTLLQLEACSPVTEQMAKLNKVTELTRFLVENCCDVLGENVSELLGDLDEDSLSSQQHDSAYDSPGPDADSLGSVQGEAAGGLSIGCPRDDGIFFPATTRPAPFNRRRSEPILPHTPALSGNLRGSVGSRSQEDCTRDREQTLKKPASDDSFLLGGRRAGGGAAGAVEALLPPWSVGPAPLYAAGNLSKDGSRSSSCSLESNQSEGSVFASSPPPVSPVCVRRSNSTRQPSSSASGGATEGKDALEAKRRSHSMRLDKVPLRTKTLGGFSFSRGSLKKGGHHQRERPFSTCGTLQEDSPQSEGGGRETPVATADKLIKQRRPLSAIEVFRQVDAKLPCAPPPYAHAVLGTALPAAAPPPQYRTAMTVQDARELGRRSRPASVHGDFAASCRPVSRCASSATADCFAQMSPAAAAAVGVIPPYRRPRALSESVSRCCSQQLPFEDFSYAKESYV